MTALQYAFAIAFGVLGTASVTTYGLRIAKPENATLKNVAVIVRSWWMILGVFLLSLALGPLGLMALFYFVTAFALHEYLKISRLSEIKSSLFPVLLIALTCQYLALYFESTRLFYALVPLMAIWILPAIVVLNASIKNLAEVFGTTFGLMLVSYYLSHVPAIAILLPGAKSDPDQATIAIVTLVLLTEGNDVFQFLSGKLFGRKKIVPLVSPNKTEAGFIGGLLLTTLVSTFGTRSLLGLEHAQAALLGVSVSIAGMLGDLFFSALKRYFGVKDFSHLIPGHGGLLDRLDSLILTAPVFFHLLLAFKEGLL